jgi:hypothetical protein
MRDKQILSFVRQHNFLRIILLFTLTLLLLVNNETKAQKSATSQEKNSQKNDVRESPSISMFFMQGWSLDKTKEFIKSRLEDYSEDIRTDRSFGTAKKVFVDNQLLEFREKLLEEGYLDKDLEIFKPEGCYIWLAYKINSSDSVGTSIRLTRIAFADLIIQNPEFVKTEVRLETLYGKRTVIEYGFLRRNYWITKNSSANIPMTHSKISKEVIGAFNHAARLCKEPHQVEDNQ